MWLYPFVYDIIVIGAGHAGCEAAWAGSKTGLRVLMLSSNLDSVGKMSCNPAIGGVGKGQLVCEIGAFGGIMPKVIDQTGIQFRMLNASKGPAVHSPRAQADKYAYAQKMKRCLEMIPNLDLLEGTVESFTTKENSITGVITKEHVHYRAKTVIISSGTFLKGIVYVGTSGSSGGRAGEPACKGLSGSLKEHGFSLGRFRTGTPPRIDRKSVNFSGMAEQKGEEGIQFSSYSKPINRLPQVSCWITRTTKKTKDIILSNAHRSLDCSIQLSGKRPRYCPSIDDKMTRFADKPDHQVFIEPEGLDTDELYPNGLSTTLPIDVQWEFMRSIQGLENVKILRSAYCIEYDYVISGQLLPSLETKSIEGLFLCGQINGTTGYEEAAAQGLIAGINASNKILNRPAFVPLSHEAYIGVMLEDLTSKIQEEPYRMFTSRAEHRLTLRQDNAAIRLAHYAYDLGLIDKEFYQSIESQKQTIQEELQRFKKTFVENNQKQISLSQLLSHHDESYSSLMSRFQHKMKDHGKKTNSLIETEIKYAGYIDRQKKEMTRVRNAEKILIPCNVNFSAIDGLCQEAKESLMQFQPASLGHASRLAGITVSDLQVLMIYLKKHVSS
ncbi:tRNA uridine-5-carboxymethylaminomethyl(34) synthesis enzyme MnmG [Candidatus Clavichlamydia salmonicola]|uniref:tRNA uridine-5-carboxymethylaminomethyl(34) synthesis enzyme MnmG n=1 Tax=Candidatus Clavichlamydia salmonicola TaxID=469812 RepID=UPI0018916DF8|nr:tRNA uridine-5-carboxymethylaminomethyl(34) synthesis enzyme MnmG [Candidatus Clavichlamydia salmonicola]